MNSVRAGAGFTLVELLVALLILSLTSLMAYRGLGAVLETRDGVGEETARWRRVSAFSERFGQDVRLAAPGDKSVVAGSPSAWRGQPDAAAGPLLQFNRFASTEGVDAMRRVAYALNARQEVELWLWPGEGGADAQPARYTVIDGVSRLDLQYMDASLAWVSVWPATPGDATNPRAVRLRLVLATGVEVVRVFAVGS